MTTKEDQQDNHQILKLNEVLHTEEVVIGIEQGMTFPTKIGTSLCNALIDTGATKSCISEKFYQQLPTINMQKLKNVSVKSATGSDLIPLGVIYCSFELGNTKFYTNLIVCRNLTPDLLYWGEISFYNIISLYVMLKMGNVYWLTNNKN